MIGGICWYCHWGWPKVVCDIYNEASRKLMSSHALQFGPSHIVWSDENFEDEHIDWCLNEIATNRSFYDSIDSDEIEIVKESLLKLKAIPERIRCCEPEDYDGEHPENFPPPKEIEFSRKGAR